MILSCGGQLEYKQGGFTESRHTAFPVSFTICCLYVSHIGVAFKAENNLAWREWSVDNVSTTGYDQSINNSSINTRKRSWIAFGI